MDEGIAFPLYYPHSQILNKKCGVPKKKSVVVEFEFNTENSRCKLRGEKKRIN